MDHSSWSLLIQHLHISSCNPIPFVFLISVFAMFFFKFWCAFCINACSQYQYYFVHCISISSIISLSYSSFISPLVFLLYSPLHLLFGFIIDLSIFLTLFLFFHLLSSASTWLLLHQCYCHCERALFISILVFLVSVPFWKCSSVGYCNFLIYCWISASIIDYRIAQIPKSFPQFATVRTYFYFCLVSLFFKSQLCKFVFVC